MMNWSSEECKKDTGWMQKNGECISEDVNDVNESISLKMSLAAAI